VNRNDQTLKRTFDARCDCSPVEKDNGLPRSNPVGVRQAMQDYIDAAKDSEGDRWCPEDELLPNVTRL
jgi:hypothetical protein